MVSLFWTAAGIGLPDTVDYKYPDGSINFFVVLFFASFILILNWTLLQVKLFDCAKSTAGQNIDIEPCVCAFKIFGKLETHKIALRIN
jgi:hypothetical protein